MLGQLNVLLAETVVPYDIVSEMEEINEDVGHTDLMLCIGTNDTINSLDDPTSVIASIPVLHVWDAKEVIVMTPSFAAGYADVENPVFFNIKSCWATRRKKTCEDLKVKVKTLFAK
jgi:NAD/NADP transhydrogenase beta subunit